MLRQSEIARASIDNQAVVTTQAAKKGPAIKFAKITRIEARKAFLVGSEVILVPSLVSPDDRSRVKTISLKSPNPVRLIEKAFFNWLVDRECRYSLNPKNGTSMNFYLRA